MYFLKDMEQGNEDIIIAGEIWSSRPLLWKVAIIKNFGKFLKNRLWQSSFSNIADAQPAILMQKSFQQKWF